MEPKKPKPGADLRQIHTGIRLVLEEIRDLKVEAARDRGESRAEAARDREEARAEAARDREQAARDREEAASDRRRLGETMERIAADATRDRRQISQALIVIGRVGRQILATQREHTSIIQAILKRLGSSGNARGGNGRR